MSFRQDGLQEFLNILPLSVRERLHHQDLTKLVEVVLDYGRPAEARFSDHFDRMNDLVVTRHDIDFVVESVGEFGQDNRAGIERTLHRISCIRNRRREIIGLTCRVGRALEGTINIIDDIVRSGKSILLLGKPGIGKTTKLREVARVLADEVRRRVVIVDTSNEIAGDGDIPHPAIGSARRMQVSNPDEQYHVMIEAVENHMPEVVVIDEIGTELEAAAARTIAERGVQLIGTAHGQTLENLLLNPTLSDLVGGIQTVTLSDEEARKRGSQKTVLERKAPPTFDIVIELIDYNKLSVHSDVQKTVDLMLRGVLPRPQIRVQTEAGELQVVQEAHFPEKEDQKEAGRSLLTQSSSQKVTQATNEKRAQIEQRKELGHKGIYAYGVARTRLERAIRERKVDAFVTNELEQADAVLVLRSIYQTRPARLRLIAKSVPILVIKSNSYNQILDALDQALKSPGEDHDLENKALDEAVWGMEQVQLTGKPIELSPQDAHLRKVQHHYLETKQFRSEGIGEEPFRRLRILPQHQGR